MVAVLLLCVDSCFASGQAFEVTDAIFMGNMEADNMNKIVKVYGHHRAGNNYLCALLYKNFYDGNKEAGRMIDRQDREFFLFGEKVQDRIFYHPYANIFGSHLASEVRSDSIYIIRDVKDVYDSVQKMKHKVPFTYEHHIINALKHRPYIVYYEDLKDYPVTTLKAIRRHFYLSKVNPSYTVEVGYCGWKE